jgi:acyl-CoA synthetase (NDP forming)
MVTSITTLQPLRPGGVSLFGQTGVFASGFAAAFSSDERFGISRIACLGNKADLADTEFLDFFAEDDATRVLGIYVEGVRDGRAWSSSLARVSRRKPVIVLKSGRTVEGARAVSSHTGTMAGEDAVYDAVLRRAGVLRVDSFERMFDLAKAFEFCQPPAGNRIGVISITGLGCVLTSDLAAKNGLRLPEFSAAARKRMREVVPQWAPLRNPADIWSAIEKVGAREAYASVALAAAADKKIDILGLIFVLIPESDFEIETLARALQATGKPALATILGGAPEVVRKFRTTLEENRLPVYTSVDRMLVAAGALAFRASFVKGARKK